jgi:hypothetical protein
VIALHSPSALCETGLWRRPPEKTQQSDRLHCRALRSLQSGLLSKYREKIGIFRVFPGNKEGNFSALRLAGGESGIRTHVTLSSKHAFQACAFSHSAISPANSGRNDRFFRKAIALAPTEIQIRLFRLHYSMGVERRAQMPRPLFPQDNAVVFLEFGLAVDPGFDDCRES